MDASSKVPMSQEQKEQISQEFYGRPFSELTTNEAKSVGGGLRGGALADPDHAPPPPSVQFGESNIVDPGSMEMKAKQSKTTESTE